MPMETKREAQSKYRILRNILNTNNYEFALIVFSKGLKQKCIDGYVDSETKRIIDAGIKEIDVLCDNKSKQQTIADYARSKGCKLRNLEWESLPENMRTLVERGIVFINATSPDEPDEQHPNWLHVFKQSNLDSTVLMTFYDWFCDESPLDEQEKTKVAVLKYAMLGVGGKRTVKILLKKIKEHCKCKVNFKEFTKSPLRKFLAIIDSDTCYTCKAKFDCWGNRY